MLGCIIKIFFTEKKIIQTSYSSVKIQTGEVTNEKNHIVLVTKQNSDKEKCKIYAAYVFV